MSHPLHFKDSLDPENPLDHPIEVIEILHIDLEDIDPLAIGGRVDIGAGDVGLTVGDRSSDTGEHPLLIDAMNANTDRAGRVFFVLNINRKTTRRLEVR